MGFPLRWSIASVAVAVLVSAAITAHFHRALLPGSGLRAVAPAQWRGYIIFPDRELYRLVVQTNGDADLDLDGERVIDASAVRPEARVERGRGLHEVRIGQSGPAPTRPPKLLWATEGRTPTDVPSLLLVHDVVPPAEVRRRIVVAAVAPWTPFACALLLLGAAAAAGVAVLRRMFGGQLGPIWAWLAVGALFAAGMTWGLPDVSGWAADELNPALVRDSVDVRFSGGWATLYPPLQFVLFALVNAPFHLFAWLNLGDVTDLRFHSLMFLTGRALSLLMALGTVAVVCGLGREVAGRRAGALAAAVVAVALPFAYYAKLANLDAPYVFWMALSMVFFTRAVRDGRPRDFYLFTAAGVVAACTKDQAYGFYALPALYMVLGRFLPHGATRPGVPPPRTLVVMAVITITGVVLLQNVVFNPAGFLEHLRILAGPGSESFRMYPPTFTGQVRLLGSAAVRLGEAMSWPLFLAALWAITAAIRERATAILWLLLPAVSYYITLVAVVGYHYDRFYLGVIVLLALAAGWWLDRWTGTTVRFRRWRAALVGIAFAYALARVVSLDALMIRDSRYFVENWLVTRAGADERVVASGMERYLPRRSNVFYTMMPQDIGELEATLPDYVVVNPWYSSRRSPGSRRHEMYEALQSGEAGYELVLRHRTRLWWSPLDLEDRFNEPEHDQFSNLTKINPLIEVYRRRAARTPATASSPPPSARRPTSR